VVQSGFNAKLQTSAESIFAIGNGLFGARANHEEAYTGESLLGHYVGGVYFPDKTKVGWWKNGYPEFFAKVLNAPNWSKILITVGGQPLDLASVKPTDFRRTLDMQKGLLSRSFAVDIAGATLRITSERFISMAHPDAAHIRFSVDVLSTASDAPIQVSAEPWIDGAIRNDDSNYDEFFWNTLDVVHTSAPPKKQGESFGLLSATKKTAFENVPEFLVATAMTCSALIRPANSKQSRAVDAAEINNENGGGYAYSAELLPGDTLTVNKSVSVQRALEPEPGKAPGIDASHVLTNALEASRASHARGWDENFKEHVQAWAEIWAQGDIEIEGDPAAQQAIRFNIFHLNQTYRGDDDRLNIGPKGFTGEKYGGAAYWDTEAYCLPFYLNTRPDHVARQLLVYRRNHLQAAIENAESLGFTGGAALYPMVTMDGRECHNEWEITFEEIHRNGSMVFAIYNYIRHTGDWAYLTEGGYEVVIAVARFWAQRVSWSEAKQAFVILGVTGPNEYENNINNNWYTNRIAMWCLEYAIEAHQWLSENHPKKLKQLHADWAFDPAHEHDRWRAIISDMHYPLLKGTRVFLQQEGYMDKVQMLADELPAEQRPINQHWSWDRILRSSLMKQADVLQGLYFFEDRFDEQTLQENFAFHEPRTVHESSLSPCVHAVLAASLDRPEKAYEMYLRTARLDLDDYNSEVHEGLHITSMAGTWMAVVEGFGGLRVKDDILHLSPRLPSNWSSFSFHVQFRGRSLKVEVSPKDARVTRISGEPLELVLAGKAISC